MSDYSLPEDDRPPRSDGIPEEDLHASFDELQPDTQGEDPLDAELGPDGEGDILPEDEPEPSGDGPDDLRVSDLP